MRGYGGIRGGAFGSVCASRRTAEGVTLAGAGAVDVAPEPVDGDPVAIAAMKLAVSNEVVAEPVGIDNEVSDAAVELSSTYT